MLDLHRHDEYSTYDGYGKPAELANLAKSYGYTALGISNHGTTAGMVQHHLACVEADIKPVLGVEGYFLPKLKEKTRGQHLCLFAKNLQGYHNINRIQFQGEKQSYYNPIWTFKELSKWGEGIICTSACVGGSIPQALMDGNVKLARKLLEKFLDIFGEDFYIEIQPFKVDDEGLQEETNVKLIELAKEYDVKCILTSDSHYTVRSEFETYLKLHEMAKHDVAKIAETYHHRYLPKPEEFVERFIRMHSKDFGERKALKLAKEFVANLEELESKIDGDILGKLELDLPTFDDNHNSSELIIKNVKKGLRKRGKHKDKKYIKRCKEELEVINHHGFDDYFLIVEDYVNFAKDSGIVVGSGRGSVCNSQVAWALRITEVDSLKYGLDFRRFLRMDKKGFPDIDLDFPTDRRDEVIEYLLNKYPNNACRVASYGLYKVDNLINDLVKVCNCDDEGLKAMIKKHINKFADESKEIDLEALKQSPEYKSWNKQFDGIMTHFTRLYKKVRFFGTHAAGVAICGGDITRYTAIKIDSKKGQLCSYYDLADLEKINLIKFDILGLSTMQSIAELRELTGCGDFDPELAEDEDVIEAFRRGDTDGIFQFDKNTPKEILRGIETDCFEDVIATSSMNRPAPLKLKMPELYASNKINGGVDESSPYYEYVKDTYGTIIYQEQVMQIAHYIGGLEWTDCDKIIKMEAKGTEKKLKLFHENYEKYWKQFKVGAKKHGMSSDEAKQLFDSFFMYSFNKGHVTGYSLISAEEMYYKVYHPTEFWYVKVKYAPNDAQRFKYIGEAIGSGVVCFLPHVNYTSETSLRKVDGEHVIQQGMVMIKGCGAKACDSIESERLLNGNYKSEEDFIQRMSQYTRTVNKKIIALLKEHGALEFNKKKYISRTIKYNASWVGRANRRG